MQFEEEDFASILKGTEEHAKDKETFMQLTQHIASQLDGLHLTRGMNILNNVYGSCITAIFSEVDEETFERALKHSFQNVYHRAKGIYQAFKRSKEHDAGN